jgi:hypothetical protein
VWREMRVVFAYPIEGGVYEQSRTQRAFYRTDGNDRVVA